GTGEASPALDRDILRARKDAPILKRWIEREVPESVRRCVRTHRIAALAAGAEYIYEIADAPECLGMRQRVVDLEDALIAKLEDYRYLTRDDTHMRVGIVLR